MSDRDELNAWLLVDLFGVPDEPCACGKHAGEAHSQQVHFTTDLSGSWEGAGLVLEALAERGYYPSLYRTNNPTDAKWRAWVTVATKEGGTRDIFAHHASAPMAVALAARAALEAEGAN